MTQPLIGITLHPDNDPDRLTLDRLVAQIVQGVERAGGLPVLIPLGLPAGALRALLARLDGVLFSGGGDIEAARYGAGPHPSMGGVDPERDRTEIDLAHWAAEAGTPALGICRGAQVINVAFGGTLYRDIAEHPGALKHTYRAETEAALLSHAVQVEEESLLARVLGQPLVHVNSLHHQALRQVAPALRVAARAADGLVEAVELPEHRFMLAVQWHPECLPAAPEQRRLFEAFVAAAAGR
ncbi:MAG: gamma-glutamyl-gamma-aminobutyrate hydrolase family protein [Anaerolineales bacterium]|nr:gamma-glutamyl-gamma-aminobutyrate hydrolase family protein [Anaerolineales bacterium]